MLKLAFISAVALAVIAIPASAIGGSTSSASPFSLSGDLLLAKQATAKYHDPAVALEDGFGPTGPCVFDSNGAGMGVHWDHFFRLRDLVLDPERPDILLYEPTPDGPRLVGVEYWIIDIDQDLDTDFDRPSLFGVPFDGPMLGHAPGMPIHYDLHVWLWRHNPNGTFAQFNPKVACP